MKQEMKIEKKAESQNRQSIKDTFAGARVKGYQMNCNVTATNDIFNIFLNQNLGKGPPGRTRSPVAARGHPPAVEERPPENKAGPPVGNSNDYNKVQLIFIKTKFNLLQTFNYLNMKKQILILVVFVLAAFVSVTKSYGQATALKPSPGTPYTYEIAPSGLTVTGTETYLWYVTEGTNLLTGAHTAANLYFAVGAGAGESTYDVTASATKKINLTWNSASVGKTFYLVVVYTAQTTNANTVPTTCTVQNMKSYEIVPMNTLELTVSLAKSDGTDNTAFPQICAPDIFSATVTAGTSVNYNYGTMTFYYNIKASGMDGQWQPKVQLAALKGNSQAYTDVSWSKNAGGAWTSMTGFAAGGTAQSLSVADEAATVPGSNFLVRVVINNAGYETLTQHDITLSADGFVTGSSPLLSDIVGGGTYTQALPFAKAATYSVTPRPTIGNVPGPDGATFFNKVP